MPALHPIHTIIIFPKIQPDTAIAVFLLQEFGEKLFPGASQAKVEFMTALPAGKTAPELEASGALPIDLGGGIFDHHHGEHGKKKNDCAATLVAKYLGVEKDVSLKKLLTYAKRDDLEGKGTISPDPIDRAFGFSGLITTMGRVYRDHPDYVLSMALPYLRAYYLEERKRQVEMPTEWKQMLETGRGREEIWHSMPASPLRVAVFESENISLAGFLRAFFRADLVIQRFPSGHTNLVTNQKNRLDLKPVVAALRLAELRAAGREEHGLTREDLERPGRLDIIPEWFFDTAANTIQNGGINPQDTPATRLSLDQIAACAKQAFGEV